MLAHRRFRLLSFLILIVITFVVVINCWIARTGAQSNQPTVVLFFDRSEDPDFLNAHFGQPVIDSQGRLLIATTYASVSCGFGICDHKLTSISPDGSLNWLSPSLSNDSLANNSLVIGPGDVAYYLASRNMIYAFQPSGEPQQGWPVEVPYNFGVSPVAI